MTDRPKPDPIDVAYSAVKDDYKQGILRALAGFDARQLAKPSVVKTKRKPRPKDAPRSEYQEQAEVCDWLKAHSIVYFATLNGAFLKGDSESERGTRWRMMARVGAKKGVPDLLILSPPTRPTHIDDTPAEALRPYVARMQATGGAMIWPRFVFIEMKSETGRANPDQLAWHCTIEACGGVVLMGTAKTVIAGLEGLGWK